MELASADQHHHKVKSDESEEGSAPAKDSSDGGADGAKEEHAKKVLKKAATEKGSTDEGAKKDAKDSDKEDAKDSGAREDAKDSGAKEQAKDVDTHKGAQGGDSGKDGAATPGHETKEEGKEEKELAALEAETKEKCTAPPEWTFDWKAWQFHEGHTMRHVNVLQKPLTVKDAIKKCAETFGCAGFTFKGPPKTEDAVKVVFLSAWDRSEPQGECDANCRMSASEYRAQDMCKPETMERWRRLARMGNR